MWRAVVSAEWRHYSLGGPSVTWRRHRSGSSNINIRVVLGRSRSVCCHCRYRQTEAPPCAHRGRSCRIARCSHRWVILRAGQHDEGRDSPGVGCTPTRGLAGGIRIPMGQLQPQRCSRSASRCQLGRVACSEVLPKSFAECMLTVAIRMHFHSESQRARIQRGRDRVECLRFETADEIAFCV